MGASSLFARTFQTPVQPGPGSSAAASASLRLASKRCIVPRRAAVPIAMTTDPAVAKRGCLFYLVRSREALAS